MSHRNRHHAGDRTRPIDLHEQHLTTVDHIKSIDFGRAAVPAPVVDLLLAMPVAQREIGEAGASWPVGSDEIGNVIVVRAESPNGSVSQPNANEAFRQFHVVHIGREIVKRSSVKQWCRQEDSNFV